MEIPMITSFVEGLRLFWQNKRLRWLLAFFLVGIVWMTVTGTLGLALTAGIADPVLRGFIAFIFAATGGVIPMFFLFATIVTALRQERFLASDESYSRSFVMLIPWLIVSGMTFAMLLFFFLPFLEILIFGIAFVGWISFQAYFSTRTSLRYAEKVQATEISDLKMGLVFASNIFCYLAIAGSFLYTTMTNLGALLANPFRLLLLLLGTALALLFSFLNSIIIKRNRNTSTVFNIALLGLFISLYSAYFIYNAGQTVAAAFQPVDLIISIFFVFYTMSSVGQTLASRAERDTRLKISAQTAAMITFFLASGYYFTDMLFPILFPDPSFGAAAGDLVKLFIFPFVALVMEFLFLRRLSKPAEPEEEPVEGPPEEEEMRPAPTVDEEEPVHEEPDEVEPRTEIEGEPEIEPSTPEEPEEEPDEEEPYEDMVEEDQPDMES